MVLSSPFDSMAHGYQVSNFSVLIFSHRYTLYEYIIDTPPTFEIWSRFQLRGKENAFFRPTYEYKEKVNKDYFL